MSLQVIQTIFNRHKQKIDRVAGIILMIIAVKLILVNYI